MSAGLIAADIASALTSLGSFGYSIYQDQRDYNTATSQYNQQYALQKDALYNGYQIKAQDMAKAGINPLLAGSGSGSTTSNVSNASVTSTPVQSAQFGSMYLAAKQLQQQQEQFESDYDLKRQDTYIKLAENARKAGLYGLEKEILQRQSANLEKTGESIDVDIAGKRLENWLTEQKKEWYSKNRWSPGDQYPNHVQEFLSLLRLIFGDDFVEQYANPETGVLKGLKDNHKDDIGSAVDSAKKGVKDAVKGAKDVVSGAKNKVLSKAEEVKRKAWSKLHSKETQEMKRIYDKARDGERKLTQKDIAYWKKYKDNVYLDGVDYYPDDPSSDEGW